MYSNKLLLFRYCYSVVDSIHFSDKMIVRSLSGIDRQASCNYVVLPPGMPLVASTPARTPCCEKPSSSVAENAVVTSGVLTSIFVFLMWVGAWGALDTIVVMLTENPEVQLGMYAGVLAVGVIGVWVHVKDWRGAEEGIEDGFRV